MKNTTRAHICRLHCEPPAHVLAVLHVVALLSGAQFDTAEFDANRDSGAHGKQNLGRVPLCIADGKKPATSH